MDRRDKRDTHGQFGIQRQIFFGGWKGQSLYIVVGLFITLTKAVRPKHARDVFLSADHVPATCELFINPPTLVLDC